MYKTTIALAAGMMAATAIAAPGAQAGVRIGFGFPIGALIAQKHYEQQRYEAEKYRAMRAAQLAEAVRLKRKRAQAIAAAEAKKDRPGNSYRLKIKASGTPTKPLRSTLKTEMYRLFQRASRLVNASGEKNCR